MSLDAHVVPLHVFVRGEFPAPVEKLCRGKGTAYMRVGRRSWARDAAGANAAATGAWQAAVGVAPAEGDAGAGFHELMDGDCWNRLRAYARAQGACPHLLAEPATRVVWLPVRFDAPRAFDLLGPGRPFALGSGPAVAAELDRLNGALGQAREWDAVGEGELAAEPRDKHFAEKTAWAILRWLVREGERLRLPVILAPGRETGGA